LGSEGGTGELIGGASRRPTRRNQPEDATRMTVGRWIGTLGRKADPRRKPRVDRKARREDATAGESRRMGSKGKPSDRLATKVDGRSDGLAGGRTTVGESRRLGSEGKAGGLTGDASQRSTGRSGREDVSTDCTAVIFVMRRSSEVTPAVARQSWRGQARVYS